MARGNQREKAREKNLKEQANQSKKNTMSGTQQAKAKEDVAALMRKKQAEADARKAAEAETKKK